MISRLTRQDYAICTHRRRPPEPHAHKAFSCCCCCEVRWTTFLGLQFQMDCVGLVIAGSVMNPLGRPSMMVEAREGWGFSLESVRLAMGASMPPASQFFVAGCVVQARHVTVRLGAAGRGRLRHSSHASAPSSSLKAMESPLA